MTTTGSQPGAVKVSVAERFDDSFAVAVTANDVEVLPDVRAGVHHAVLSLVHRCCCLSSVSHGKDYGSTSADNVSSGKDGRDGRLHVIVDGNRSFPAQFQSLDGAWDNRVGRYTYADDGKVNVDGFRGSGDGYGTAASAGIRLTQFHFLKHHLFHFSLFVGNVFDWVVEGQEFYTFFLGMFHLLDTCRHFFFRTTVDN